MFKCKVVRPQVKVLDADTGRVEAVVSDEGEDRDGDIIRAEGWILGHFNKHPVLLASHDYRHLSSQIGEWEAMRITDGKLVGTARYYIGQGNEEADWGFKLAQRGRAAYSVGFIPLEYKKREQEDDSETHILPSYEFLKQELLEVSHVTIPSNRNALQLMAKGADPVLGELAREELGGGQADAEVHRPVAHPSSGDNDVTRVESSKRAEQLREVAALLNLRRAADWICEEMLARLVRREGESTDLDTLFDDDADVPAIEHTHEGELPDYDQGVDDSLEAGLIATTNFAGSPRSKYGTHASKGFKGPYAAAWRCHFSKVGGGALTPAASGPIRGTVRRTEMIAAAMKPPCKLPKADGISARSGPKSPLQCTFPLKPSDYGLSSWAKPSDDGLTQEDIRLTCKDLAVIKHAAVAEVKRRIADREQQSAWMAGQEAWEEYKTELGEGIA